MEAQALIPFDRLAVLAHIAALKAALTSNAARYGATDEVRRLLAKPQR